MNYPVIKGASYILAHTPDMVLHNGTTQTTEKVVNPDSEYLKELPKHLRNFEDVLNYAPNQTYIGNMTPDQLGEAEMPWWDKKLEGNSRFGRLGEIMPQDEFIGLMEICDVFDLVLLEKSFVDNVKIKLEKHPLIDEDMISKIKDGVSIDEIKKVVDEEGAEGLYNEGNLVGCVKKAHDVDVNLSAHTMLENLVVKASGVLSLLNLIAKNNIDPNSIDYVIECSEEACGDMNQRGGGNFAKSLAEVAGFTNATGADMRGFCAGPTHSLIAASALVQSGVYDNVVIAGGGASAKLGMNGKDHVKKEMPILEDCLGGFAVLVSKNDGVNPILRTDLVGKHTVGTGSSPQAVISSLVTDPLDKAGLKITDVDKYSVEMQNPDITKPAGAGDVPQANYKMIGALGVKKKHIEKKELKDFIQNHGMSGWAPTQGHIPSGVPYIGFARKDLTEGNLNRVMIVGKGSLFLGRMTNLFDGVSIIIERNTGYKEEEKGISEDKVRKIIAESIKKLASQLVEE
ncbi:glycine/sarcosine/betaine reductase complex component C subunit beta [Clostridium botulinum]|uniref:Glycine reductase n=2 Tax=Clostridium botulinum TaxID=1491 RepID=A0A846HZB4_CLOBO|nr:glycine/sarcosine/betaine reductase complex component C subunit beta [Clostridium botulinum]AJD28754.1 glycine/sarcosine/betaine reductase complex component C subunit beta [Clostridium botulinum CDC_297]ACQ55213.1 glycine reductase complex component C, beta subunit [Clostridium botulinum Ba4 str. 657]AJE13078.1 glycine/sarcosine/betaine reductase complex component C subunit beta [Clostridium botulinum CDC_1436]APU60143.1 glycine/sarcosine/betaine reductase complex component C subunit beta [C